MELKDVLSMLIAVIPAMIGVWKLFKDVNWSLPKTTKYNHLLDNYSACLDPLEVAFLKSEIKKEVKQNVLRVLNPKFRNRLLYVRTHCHLDISAWRWGHLAPHIQMKYGKFFIRYKGRYRLCRWGFRAFAVFYFTFGTLYAVRIYNPDVVFYQFLAVMFFLACVFMGGVFWGLLPGKKIIKKYNAALLKIDGADFSAYCR
ncbi:hypothetical protein GWD52_17450 [Enterobacteriaceae bacterium 4M9]|nr:hypothetical protein [Enterobacteriaceae bacterium 4M9]